MRALNFIENNRPGDARSDANRRAVRSWAARDPLLKSGERAKRRRKRYKPPSIVFIDDRAIEALQGTTVPNASTGPDADQSASSSQGQSASPAPRQVQAIRASSQENINYIQVPDNRKPSLSGSEQYHPPPNYYNQHANAAHSYPPAAQPNGHPNYHRGGHVETRREHPSFGPPLSNRPITIYQNFGPPPDSERSRPSTYAPGPSQAPYNGYIDPINTTVVSIPLSQPASYPPRQDPTYQDPRANQRRNDSLASSSTYSSRPDERYPEHTTNQQRTNSLPTPSPSIPIDDRSYQNHHHYPPNSFSLPAIRTPPLARRERVQLPPLLPESRASILGSTYSDSPVSAHPKDTSFTAFATHYRYPTLTQQTHPPLVETVTPMQTPSREIMSPGRRISTQSSSNFTPRMETIETISQPVATVPQPQPPSKTAVITSTTTLPIAQEEASAPPQIPKHHGTLSLLPPEIRAKIYSHLLVSPTPDTATYGPGSGISTSILSTCRAIYCEAVDQLYTSNHLLTLNPSRRPSSSPPPNPATTTATTTSPSSPHQQPQPPYRAISRMHSLTISLPFSTLNRGDCETALHDPNALVAITEPIALSLLHSTALSHLTLRLLNTSQRKTGAKRFRLAAVAYEMKRVMFPFAYLKRRVAVQVEGFDTIEFAEVFGEMREEFAGRDPPAGELLEDALMEG